MVAAEAQNFVVDRAAYGERSGERQNSRNGYRERPWETRAGSIPLKIPKLRAGSYFPPFLEPRRTAEKALAAVIQEAYVQGVSTRSVDELVKAMGMSGISKSQVSRLCAEIDERVGAFLDRPLEGDWPYLWIDATYVKAREAGRIVSKAVIIAVAVNTDGQREVLGRIRLGLNDVPVSRPVTDDPATQWGIRVPGDPAHRIYVWIDALFNYFTAVDTPERKKFWPARVHLIGKDILWFHAVIWPALLMALGEELPRTIFGHGWWISEGQKMSKSLGNFIDLERLKTYSDRYSLDALRWFLATQGPMSGADADFSHARFIEVYNAELANGIGNASSRVGNMIVKYFDGRVPEHKGAMSLDDYDWANISATHVRAAREHAELFNLAESLGQGIALVREVDGYINKTEPFRLAKRIDEPGARERLGVILYHCAEALRVASLILSPAMPNKMPDLWTNWGWSPAPGAGLPALAEFGGEHSLRPGTQVRKGDALFMRAEE